MGEEAPGRVLGVQARRAMQAGGLLLKLQLESALVRHNRLSNGRHAACSVFDTMHERGVTMLMRFACRRPVFLP